MKASTALLELFKESSGWRAFFRSCSETSALRLRSQALQFRDELKERGHGLPTEEVEVALLGLARELLPDTPAAQWDAECAHDLCKNALARLAKLYVEFSTTVAEVLDLSVQEESNERMHDAGGVNDPVAFLVALDGWTRAGLEDMEPLRIRGGAA